MTKKVTIKMLLLANCAVISFIMGFTAPIVSPYFMGQLFERQDLIGQIIMLGTFVQFGMSVIKQSSIAVRFFVKHYTLFSIVTDIGFALNALIAGGFPVYGFLVYNILTWSGVDILNLIRKDTINQVLSKTDLTIFDAKCNSIKVAFVFLGTFVSTTIASMIGGEINIHIALLAEALVCALGHAMQIRANKRIRKEILKESEDQITVKEFVTDVFKRFCNLFFAIYNSLTAKKKVDLVKHKKDILDQ